MKVIGASVDVTYEQDADGCSDNETQYLTVKIKDGGGGAYFVIETNEWAIDSPEELVEKLNALMTQVRGLVEGEEQNDERRK